MSKTVTRSGSHRRPHTAVVVVTAWDDPTGEKGWTKTYELSDRRVRRADPDPDGRPRRPTPTEAPTPTPTEAPTPTPTEAPTPDPDRCADAHAVADPALGAHADTDASADGWRRR